MNNDLNDPDIRPLWQAVADRLESGADAASIKTLRVALNQAGRARLTGWLATSLRGRRLKEQNGLLTVPVPKLLEALGMNEEHLHTFVENLIGISDNAQIRRDTEQARRHLWEYAAKLLPDTPRLVAGLRTAGVSKESIGTVTERVEALARARTLLPLRRPVHLARLALTCAGDPHYFDLAEPGNGARLVHMTSEILNQPIPDTPLAERLLLAKVGIYAERLSQTVLVLNIDAVGDSVTDEVIRAAKAARRPHHLSLYDLTENPPTLANHERWQIVENPSVLEEAMIRRPDAPIVCTRGAFAAVDHALLFLARAQGVPMSYSGDLDRGGRTAAHAAHRYGADIHLMDDATEHDAIGAGPLMTWPQNVPVVAHPSQVPSTHGGGLTVFQEHPALLDRLLGPDPEDPLHPSRLTQHSR
ncbi:DUF2399 domain-containing protein [Catenulispora sp. NF23]|uniref:TIGR02679 domain-containing protein n=1 Tax=Catenulispora pinistramenti TaxID=2705254 RepID=UPI001BA8CEE8|nr:TIGR02679 domain-containing protein [Catenulispora pinistramenti]MBS2531674.1 DUF2399 domain-containing protein [Catenulispora pinistramenti]